MAKHISSGAPNIVWFITDDTGDCMLGYAGGKVLTPNIDRIAHEGVIARQYHSTSPACTPSRYSYLTGWYPQRCPSPRFRHEHEKGKPANIDFNVDLIPGQTSIASILRDVGYATGFTGKWHTGIPMRDLNGHTYDPDEDPRDPETAEKLHKDYESMREQIRGAGFDYAEGIAWGNTDTRPLKALHYHNLEWHTEAALHFLEQQKDTDQPFFLNMATTTMHGPHHVESLETDGRAVEWGFLDQAPDVQPPRASVFQRVKDAGLEVNHHTAGALWMDDAFGAVMKKVEDMGLADNTIFIWSTDHGMGVIGSKFTCFQGGVRIPHCMKWNGHIPAGTVCDALLQNVDFLPTLCEAAGVAVPEDHPVDGKSYWPVMTGQQQEVLHEDLYFEWGATRAVRTEKWKYIAFRLPPEAVESMQTDGRGTAFTMRGKGYTDFPMRKHPGYFDPDQLYDLENDPDEQHNLVGDPAYADVLRDLKERLAKYVETFDYPFPADPDPFMLSDEYRKLAEASRADNRLYESYFIKQKAY